MAEIQVHRVRQISLRRRSLNAETSVVEVVITAATDYTRDADTPIEHALTLTLFVQAEDLASLMQFA